MTWLNDPPLGPRTRPAIITKNDCRVIGTGGMGILINEPDAVSAANMAINAILWGR